MFKRGIGTQNAHIWAHVCPLDASIYWYETKRMRELLPKLRAVEIPSAKGALCPILPNLIENRGFIHAVFLGGQWMRRWEWRRAASDAEAGEIAESMFEVAARERKMLFPMNTFPIVDFKRQCEDGDFDCCADYPVEVKADFAGGLWGTGNLFVQTHEQGHKHGARHAHREVAAP